MLLYLGIISVVVVAYVIYSIFTWNYGFWKKNGVPHETPKFFFGNMKEALTGKKHFGLIYNDLYKKFNNAAYFGFYKLRVPTIVVRDPELIKAVLVKDYNSFAENDFHTDTEKDAILAVNPFFHIGEGWRSRRAQWSSVLTPSKVKGLYPIMNEKCENMVEYLHAHVKEHPNEALEARELAVKYLTDVVVSGVLGLQSNTFVDEQNVFRRIALSFFNSDFWEGITNMAYIIAPWIHSFLRAGFLKTWVKEECIDIAKNVVAIRKQHGFTKNDFFEGLMKDAEINYVDVAGRVLGFLSEGVETSSGLVSFALYELAANPQIQSKLRKSLDESAAANDGKLSFEDLHNNKYLDMITNETMRIYPAVLTFNKVCTKEYTLPPAVPGGKPFVMPVGMPVTICNYATHHDPKYFPDPQRFDPERFREEESSVHKFAYLPFGEGPRICVGLRLGLTNAKVAIAAIVRNFELRVSPKTLARPLPLDPSVLVARALGELWVTVHEIS